MIFYPRTASQKIYKVESGCVRTYFKNRGQRLVTGFYFQGDYFGLELSERHRLCADTLTASVITEFGRRQIEKLARADAAVGKYLFDITTVELVRARLHSVLLRGSVDERVANFLFEMKKRNCSKEVELVMSRRDIADYLNLTIESVSRALTRLERNRAIGFTSHRLVQVNIRKPLAA